MLVSSGEILRVNCQLVNNNKKQTNSGNTSPTTTTTTTSSRSPNRFPHSSPSHHHHHSSSSSSSVDCNLDQIITKLSPAGRILWIDTSRVTSANSTAATATAATALSPNSLSSASLISPNKKLKSDDSTSTPTTTTTPTPNLTAPGGINGLLIDAKNQAIKNAKFIDYVHTNDIGHVNKHIIDGKCDLNF